MRLAIRSNNIKIAIMKYITIKKNNLASFIPNGFVILNVIIDSVAAKEINYDAIEKNA